MDLNPLLLVMNVRRIPECLEAIAGLHIDTCWMTGYSEHQLAKTVFPSILREYREHTHLVVLSDDCVPTQGALNAVLTLANEGHDVVTGYCNMDTREDNTLVNLTRSPLKGDTPHLDHYDFWAQPDIDRLGHPVFRSWFTGMAFTTMPRHMWERFPFNAYNKPGNSSDYNLSWRLQGAGIPIMAHRDGRVHHVKQVMNQPDTDPVKRVLLGELTPQVTYRDADDTSTPDW